MKNELVFVSKATDLKKMLCDIASEKQMFGVSDSNAMACCGKVMPGDVPMYGFPAGEEQKTLDTVACIAEAMLDEGMERDACVVALGGGVVGDIAGFAASVYKRGVEFINVPTTLLAQVDSAIGGKTAVNLDGYKNMIGTFKMPSRIFICTELLSTLPEREWICGMGELVKTAFLDKELYDFVCANMDKLLSRESAAVSTAVKKAAEFKKKITDEDPTEKGLRKILNLGHTVAHALEKCDNHRLSHGEYVLLGMKIELCMLGADKGITDKLLGKVKLPALPAVSAQDVTDAAKTDKKNKDGKISLIGLKGVGEACEHLLTEREFGEKYSFAVEQLTKSGELTRE